MKPISSSLGRSLVRLRARSSHPPAPRARQSAHSRGGRRDEARGSRCARELENKRRRRTGRTSTRRHAPARTGTHHQTTQGARCVSGDRLGASVDVGAAARFDGAGQGRRTSHTVEEQFHEAVFTHASTSARTSRLSRSLDVARRQMELEGYGLVTERYRDRA